MIEDIKKCLETIEYGFKDDNGFNIYKDPKRWDDDFEEFYYLLSPDELLKTRCGTCWEQVELERKLFTDAGIASETYFICTYAIDASPCHTFLVYKDNDKYYWFENSWYNYRGIHEYNSLNDLLLDVKDKFIKDYNNLEGMTFVTKYEQPPYHLKCSEMYEYMEHQELVHLNEERYYYVIGDAYHLLTAEYLKDINMLSGEYDEYIVAFKDYKVKDGFKTFKLDINDERLEKHMLDIIDEDDIVLIKFDDVSLKEFLKECD